MNSKIVTFFAVVFIVRGIDSMALNPFWGIPTGGFQPVNPVLQPLVAELQMRLSQLSAASKSSIGQTVGLASKNIGLLTSTAKNNNKLLINNIEKNPATPKTCISANKAAINQLNSVSKTNLSFCSKNSQIQLKSMNQVHKDITQQALVVQNKVNTAVNQCTLMYPLENDTEALTSCFTEKSSFLLDEINELESHLLQTITLVQTGVDQILDMTNTCTQNLQQQLQAQADELITQLDACSSSTLPPTS